MEFILLWIMGFMTYFVLRYGVKVPFYISLMLLVPMTILVGIAVLLDNNL